MNRWGEALAVGVFIVALAGALAWAFGGSGGCSCQLKTSPADYHVPPLVLQGTTPTTAVNGDD